MNQEHETTMCVHAGATAEAIGHASSKQNAAMEAERLERENEGLAEEVLRTYEQLNVIFDVTSQLSVLTDAQQVKRLLCDRLRTILRAKTVACTDRPGPIEGGGARSPVTCGDVDLMMRHLHDMEAWTEKVRAGTGGRRVLVHALASKDAVGNAGMLYLMACPLYESEDSEPLVVTVMRFGEMYQAGDMMLLDSVLTYGGHVLRNLRLVDRLKRTSFEAVRALVNAIDKKDRYTCGHSERVGILASLTGYEMNLPPEAVQELEWAGLLHDIGKIGIPEDILNKPGRLTPEEYTVIQEHPSMSYDVLKPVQSLAGVLVSVVQHHENFDGSGYPKGLQGENITLSGRILHVVDVFDALTSDRAYRHAYDYEKAFDILQSESGTKFDPAVVDAFICMMKRLAKLRPPELEDLFASSAQGVTP